MDLSILNEDPDKVYKVTFIEGDVLKLRGKAKTCLPVIFPIDYYLDKNNVKKDTEDQSLINFQKQIIFMYNSSNSLFFAGLMANGDFKIYNVKNKTCKFIRGLPYFATPPSKSLSIKDKPELFISNDGNLMLIKCADKRSGDDYWIWTLLSTIHVKETMSIDESDKNGVWIRCVFDSLNERSQMVHSYSIDGSNSEQSNSESANFKINSSSSRIQNLERNPNLNFGYCIDAKFLKEDINEGTVVKIVQSKLFKIEDYYRSSVDSKNAHAISAVDHLKIIEIESMSYKLNLSKKGGNSILSDYSASSFKRHICKIEFISNKEHENKILIRYDNKAKLCIIALNSVHMYYCQCYFYSTETNTGYQVKLFNLVKPNDHPAFDSYGKTSLWIDDMQWSSNDLTCVIAFRAKSFAIMTRLGSLIRFITDPSVSIFRNPNFNNEKFVRTPQRFSELVYSREGLTIDRSNFTDKIKIMFEEDRFIIVDNRIFFVYSFPPFDDPYSLLNWCEKEELGFSFLRLCLSHEQLCINPENLEQIPFLMMSKLPQFEFEKNNAEIDELEDDQPAILTAAQIRPFEINRNDTSIGSFNEEFKLDPEVLLSNFIKFSVSLKWTNNHPK